MSTAQKVIKYLAIAFAISLIVGIFFGIYEAIGTIGGVITNNNTKDGLNINEYSSTSNILSIDIASAKLRIVQGNSLKVETNSEYINSKQDYNKLSVTEKKHSILNNNDEELTVYIPENMIFDKVYISSGAGTINIENITAKELELELGAGKLVIDKITTLSDTSIDGGAGEVEINNANLTNLDLDVGVGKFTINSIFEGKTEIDAGVGELNVNIIDAKENYTIYAETGIGSISIDGVSVKNESTYGVGNKRIEIDGGIGSISINFK